MSLSLQRGWIRRVLPLVVVGSCLLLLLLMILTTDLSSSSLLSLLWQPNGSLVNSAAAAAAAIHTDHSAASRRPHARSLLLDIPPTTADPPSPPHLHGLFSDAQAAENAASIQTSRTSFYHVCQEAIRNIVTPVNNNSKEQQQQQQQQQQVLVQTLRNRMNGMFRKSRIRHGTHEDTALPVETCSRVFLDLGSNAGQSVAQFISAGLPECRSSSSHDPAGSRDDSTVTTTLNPHTDLQQQVQVAGRWNAELGVARPAVSSDPRHLVKWARDRMRDFDNLTTSTTTMTSSSSGPEDYCVYSVEANPVFTKSLQAMERDMMRTTPRPLRRLHFFTNAAVNDQQQTPTKLYLDTIETKGHHLYGSSIYAFYSDVQTSKQKHHSVLSATAESITLSELLHKTVGAQRDGHIMIKLDIEGAEYKVLTEGVHSGALCSYVSRNNMKVDVLVEYHSSERVGGRNKDMMIFKNDAIRQKMLDCGVALYEIQSPQ